MGGAKQISREYKVMETYRTVTAELAGSTPPILAILSWSEIVMVA